jgi:hypothetical protein
MKGRHPNWHFRAYEATICALLLLAATCQADETADRAAIEHLIAALNTDTSAHHQGIADLFTTDPDNGLDRFLALEPWLTQPPDKTWSEVAIPRILAKPIRFVTPDVALIEAASTQYGSLILRRRTPLLFVTKRTASGWRIADFHALAPLPFWSVKQIEVRDPR